MKAQTLMAPLKRQGWGGGVWESPNLSLLSTVVRSFLFRCKQKVADPELACEQAHQYLTMKAKTRWADLSKVREVGEPTSAVSDCWAGPAARAVWRRGDIAMHPQCCPSCSIQQTFPNTLSAPGFALTKAPALTAAVVTFIGYFCHCRVIEMV